MEDPSKHLFDFGLSTAGAKQLELIGRGRLTNLSRRQQVCQWR